jgi:hypothetical protein
MADFKDLSARMSNWEMVKKLDSNKDGNVSLDEVKKIDTDGDGELSDAELNASGIKDKDVSKELKEKYKAASKTALDNKDTDGTKTNVFNVADLSTTIADLKTKRDDYADQGKTGLDTMQSFTPRAILNAAADANGDGKITLDELKHMDKEKFKSMAREAGRGGLIGSISHIDDYVEQMESEGKSKDFEVVKFNTDHDYQSLWQFRNGGGSAEIRKAAQEDTDDKSKKKSSEAKIPLLEGNIKTLEDSIAPQEAKIAGMEPKVAELEAKNAALTSEIEGLEKREKTHKPPLKKAEKERLAEARTEFLNNTVELDLAKKDLTQAKADLTQTKADLETSKTTLAQAKTDVSNVNSAYAAKKAEVIALAGGNKDVNAYIEKLDKNGQLTMENVLYLEKILKTQGPEKAGKVCADLSTFLDSNKGPMTGPQKLTLAHDILHDIAFPADIDQSNKGTCAATAIQMKLAIVDPAKYAQICTTLAQGENYTMEHRAILSDHVLKPNTTYVGDANDGRTLSCKVMQNAFMEYGKDDAGDSSAKVGGKKIHYDSRLSVDAAQGFSETQLRKKVADADPDLKKLSDSTLEDLGSGMSDDGSEALEEALFRKDIDIETNKNDIMKEINDDLAQGKPVAMTIKGHAVLITGIDNTQNPPKYIIDSWSNQYEMTAEQLKKVVLSVRYHDE